MATNLEIRPFFWHRSKACGADLRSSAIDVRYGSLAATARSKWRVRFTPESCRGNHRLACPLRAKSRLLHRSRHRPHSILRWPPRGRLLVFGGRRSCRALKEMGRYSVQSGSLGRPMYFLGSLVFAVSLLFAPAVTVAQVQPSSTGGTIGNANKSISGEGEQSESHAPVQQRMHENKHGTKPLQSRTTSVAGRIEVTSATLGQNCGAPRGNVTEKVATICNGKETCSVPGSMVNNPDPAFGCPKSFAAVWQCGVKSGTRSNSVPAVALEGNTLTLSCR